MAHQRSVDPTHHRPRQSQISPALEVVIVSFRSYPILRRCLQSLRQNVVDALPVVIHVVDNASNDGTAEAVDLNFPEVVLHRQPTNSGFAAGNNLVLRTIDAPFVLVLNPDTEVPAGILEHLLAVLEQDESVGMIGCRLVRDDGTFDHASKRSFPSARDAAHYFLRHGPASRSNYLAHEVGEFGFGRVDAINGAFMLIRTSAMRQVGYFDERYWMYAEDLDWCKRFADAGWKVLYDGRTSALHLKGGTTGTHRDLRLNWHFHKSMAIFYRSHNAGHNRALDALVYCGIGARMCVMAFHGVVHRARLKADRHTR